MFAEAKVVLAAAISLAAASAAMARDVGPPNIDLQKLCRTTQTAVSALFGALPINVFDSCMNSEKAAREQLVKDWATYSASEKALCIQPRQYQPSYVEWLTCAEMQRDVRKMKGQPASTPNTGRPVN